MKKVGLLRDNKKSKIAVLSPENIKQLIDKADFYVETKAGKEAGYSDKDYEAAGAKIVDSRQGVIDVAEVLLTYSTSLDADTISSSKTFIGAYDVLGDFGTLIPFQKIGVNLYSLNLLPRTTIAQSMDVLSSAASILGYKAVLKAASLSTSTIPMITGAGGTLRPAKVLVLGAGVAGLQAIATAKRLGAVVRAFDVRAVAKTDVESLGAQFVDIEGAKDSSSAGGYAVEQSKEYQNKVEQILYKECIEADMIICTARIPGKKAPLLVSENALLNMKSGSVIVDLAADSGGNCAWSTLGKTIVTDNNITIVGDTNLLAKSSKAASFLLGNNFTSYLKHFLANSENEEDEIINATRVITDGQVTNERIISEIDDI
ncbi:MAG: NAD(P) transhydrogenase subunit alpha [Flavobacteriales bacterium]